MIESSVGNLDEVLNDRDAFLQLHWIDELGRAESLSPLLLAVVGVDTDHSRSVSRDGSLNDGESNSSESKDGDSLS